eukprot:1380905-Pleurochrysis_carterae.AAC.2
MQVNTQLKVRMRACHIDTSTRYKRNHQNEHMRRHSARGKATAYREYARHMEAFKDTWSRDNGRRISQRTREAAT